jgi:hypothetical protein
MTIPRLPLLAAALLAAVAVLAGVTRPGPPAPAVSATPASDAASVRSTLFCPDLRTIAGTLSTQVVVGTATPADGSVTLAASTSTVEATSLLGANSRTASYSGPLTGPITLRAQGALTAGLVGEQIARANKTADRGWAEARCEPPRADQWFIGAGTTPGDTPQVVLANPGDTRAIVTITVLTPSGPIASSAGNNLVLEPHSAPQRLPLASLAPGATVTAVHVSTEVGEVSAAVRDTRVSGTTLLGTDWVPLGEPATSVTVPGLPATITGVAPRRVLYVADTGTEDTSVQVTVTTSDGTFVPTGLADKAVAAQSVIAIDLTAALGKRPAAVRVVSQPDSTGFAQPIVAGALIDATSTLGNGVQEIAYTGAAAAIAGPALVPIITFGPDRKAEDDLILSAPGSTGAVVVTTYTSAGRVTKTTAIPISAGDTREVNLKLLGATSNGSAVVTPTSTSGPIYATRLIQESGALGPLLSEYELSGAPSSEPVPATEQLPIGSTS